MQKHGGQDINLNIKLIEDFSVTTNYLGLSKIGLSRIQNFDDLTHYPNQDQQPYKQNLVNWLYPNDNNKNNFLIFGNGASELIDLLIKIFRYDPQHSIYKTKTWKPGSSTVQYIEYERSCTNYLYNKKPYNYIDTDITCIINPCNPTGEYKNIEELKKYITDNCRINSLVIVDESMQLWVGKKFRDDSLLSQTEWIKYMYDNKKISIFILHSWTKFFCCTGLRVGTLICPNKMYYDLLIKYSVPWSCNIFALKYLDGCINDNKYLNLTWKFTPKYRDYLVSSIKKFFPEWIIYGKNFLSWIWIDTLSKELAKMLYDLCKLNGVPIRLGINGYNLPTFIRIGVRKISSCNILLDIFKSVKVLNEFKYPHLKLPANLIIKNEEVDINKIYCHEKVIENRMKSLFDYIQSLDNTKIIPSIIVDYHTNVLIDGHHRLSVLKKLKYNKVSVLYINYNHPNIIVHPNSKITIQEVIFSALNNQLLTPKSTQHMIKDDDGKIHPIAVLSNLYSLKNI